MMQSTMATDACSAGKLPITAIILTFNEEFHIDRCLSRVIPLVERVVVVDSFSTDRTLEVAKRYGVETVQHAFQNYAKQFQWALDNIRPSTDWLLRLDADEYLEESAQDELRRKLARLPAEITGVEFKLKVIFRGRWIRHGRYYSTMLLRLWRNGAGQIEQRWMDEHIVLTHGRAERITSGDLVDHNLKDIGWWTDKHNRYATRHMLDHINREQPLLLERGGMLGKRPAGRSKRFLRHALYGRAPIYWRALLFYIYRYVFRLGFLDGREGFVFHFLHGLWLMVLIDAKLDDARRYIRVNGIEAFRDHLARYEGINAPMTLSTNDADSSALP